MRLDLRFRRSLAFLLGLDRFLGRRARDFSSFRKFLSTRIHHATLSVSASVRSLAISVVIPTVRTTSVPPPGVACNAPSTHSAARWAAIAFAVVARPAEEEQVMALAAANLADFHGSDPQRAEKWTGPSERAISTVSCSCCLLEGRVS